MSELLTTAEVAKTLGLSPYQVTAERKRGRLHYSRIGPRLVRFTERDLEDYRELLARESPPGQSPPRRTGGRPAR